MLPNLALPVPGSLTGLLATFGPMFTAPSFRTFCGLACGFFAQTGKRTVCGMLAGAGLSRMWPHDARPVAIPVLAKLVIKGTSSSSRLWLARRMAQAIAAALPGRCIHVVADAAFAGKELRKLPPGITWTTRLRKDAALYALPPARTGKRGRPREKGDRLGSLAALASATAFGQVTVTRYGKTAAISAAAVTCLWPSVFGTRPVTVVLIRDESGTGYDLADGGPPPPRQARASEGSSLSDSW